tara:strand:- start:2018 stop:2809 length:792 start_codon:yes stop_codon:yes gene_type:complete
VKNLQIIYPTDFSELSINTLNALIPFLKQGNNRLVLLHAAQRKRKSLAADKVATQEAFDHFVAACPGLKEIQYECRWDFAISKELILQESDKVECDLVIMATKGAKGLDRLWGSKTEAVVRDAIVPIIVLPKGAALTEVNRIVLAVDYEELTCDHRLSPLLQLADHMKTEIDVLTVNRKEEQLSRKEKMHRKQLKYRLQDFPHRFSYHFENEVGEGLIKYAKAQQASLIAIMPRDYHFLESLFHESLSRKMILDSPVPLLILK